MIRNENHSMCILKLSAFLHCSVQPQVQVVQPPKKQYVYTTQVQTYKPVVNTFTCTSSFNCQNGCNVGYKCGTDGCPICECIHPQGNK